MSTRPVHIRIRGKSYKLHATEDIDTDRDIQEAARCMEEVAAKVDERIRLPEDKLFFLTSINLALMLARERRNHTDHQERISSLVRRVEQCL
jgi:cell division protein ZapA (FtsZ GTPase activity inhibitor)